VRKIKIEFTRGPMTMDDRCALYTFQSAFSLVFTIAYGTWILLSPSRAGDQATMIGLGMLTVATFAYRVHLGHLRDREREEKEKQ
jgi:hypothetical protein